MTTVEESSDAVLQAILDSLPDPYVRLTAVRGDDGGIIDFVYADANDAACQYNRRSKAEMIGARLLDVLPGHRGSGLMDEFRKVVHTGELYSRDGLSYFNELLAQERRSDVRAVRIGDGLSLTWRDRTEEYAAVSALAESEERYRLLAENSSDIVAHTRGALVVWVSPAIERILGWHPSAVVDRHLDALVHPEEHHLVFPQAPPFDAVSRPRVRVRLLASDGTYHWFDGNGSAFISASGETDGRIAAFRLIDSEMAAERTLDRRARFDTLTGLMNRAEIIEQIQVSGLSARRSGEQTALLFCDIDKFKDVNDAHGHAAGDEVLRVMAERLKACVRATDFVARIGGDELLVLLNGVHGVGDAVAIAEKIRETASVPIPVAGSFAHATLSVGVALAVPGETVDPLIARADSAMYQAKRAGRDQVIAIPSPLVARRVLVVDDDEFLLDLIGEMLSQMGVGDVSLAHDGFEALALIDDAVTRPDVILSDLNMAGMDGIQLLRHLVARSYDGALIVMSGDGEEILTSVGELALAHGLQLLTILKKPVDPRELLRAIESVEPRHMRPERHPRHDPRVGQLTPEEVRSGIASGCVDIHVQPQVTVFGRRVVGAEALLRWRDPIRGVLSPLAVVPIAEQHGLIEELTVAVYRRAVACLADWRRQGHDLRLSVNLSTLNLIELDLPDVLAAIALEAGVATSSLVLEITESTLMEHLSISLEVINRLRLKGFGVSIDDYGMGYSNLTKLKQLPITELKVDRSFVGRADRDTALRVILGSSVALGHSLGVTVVAEGVESPEVWDLLEGLGCDVVQGYLVATPMAVGEFLPWKASWDASWS